MTNEMQLSQAAGLPFVGQEVAMAHAHNPPAKPTGMKKIHRLLRGRYPLVITLGLLFGVAGALTGYLSQKPLYKSSSSVDIIPTVQTMSYGGGEQMPGYSLLLQSQVAVIGSPERILRALDEDEWKNAGGFRGTDAAVTRFASGLEVENIPSTDIIKISYSDPDAKLAMAGAQAILDSYKEAYAAEDPMMYAAKLHEAETERTTYTNELTDYESRLDTLQKVYNTDDLDSFLARNMDYLAQLSIDLDNAKTSLDIDKKSLAQGVGGPGPDGVANKSAMLTEDQIANFEGSGKPLAAMRNIRQQIEDSMEVFRAEGYGDQLPRMQYLKSQLTVENNKIQSYVESFNQGFRGDPATGQVGANPYRADMATLQVKIDEYQKAYDKQKLLCADIGRYSQSIRDIKNNIARADQARQNADAEYDKLISMKNLNPDQMHVTSDPVQASEPSTDRRKAMAAVGFIGGALLPTLVVMLIGVLDGRFRYSDETNTDLGGVALLGILPNLPDLLTDPTQAATAAHCVHQIRTILQITGQSTERRVFAVTSASPGDGKTSLTLALGLSFAASGSRTLLVDGDLIGGGLTARLNVTAEHGVLEAMASRDFMPFIRTTDVADLSFLPVGKAMGGYTGTISPAAVRRLVDEARKHFDVLLIDTGPILGSIEASPVAVASDGVVLCVSRGQQRQLVDRALAHLHAIGARIAGVVFNRAQATDFERSTNRLGLGSVPAGSDGRRGEAIGPVARAVASSVRSASSGNDR